ncbi:hypothetical protein BH11PSE6_BH11PSE6_24980 [soil metagenome]
MKKNPLILIVLGVLMLVAGAVMKLNGGVPGADAATTARCQERMKDQGLDMLRRCDETAFATAMTATDADAAARAISAANNDEVGSNALAMFLIGLGMVMTIGGVLVARRRGNI